MEGWRGSRRPAFGTQCGLPAAAPTHLILRCERSEPRRRAPGHAVRASRLAPDQVRGSHLSMRPAECSRAYLQNRLLGGDLGEDDLLEVRRHGVAGFDLVESS